MGKVEWQRGLVKFNLGQNILLSAILLFLQVLYYLFFLKVGAVFDDSRLSILYVKI